VPVVELKSQFNKIRRQLGKPPQKKIPISKLFTHIREPHLHKSIKDITKKKRKIFKEPIKVTLGTR